jgi:hypothetical protein
MPPDINQILSSPVFRTILLIIKIVFIVISVFYTVFIVYALIYSSWLKKYILMDLEEFLTVRPYGVKKLYQQWQKLKQKLDTGLESDYKLAVIEADSTLDGILKKEGYVGETLGEKLEKVDAVVLPNMSDVSEAHLTRNNIVHNPDFRLTLEEARRVM